jgi:hypothetical protein
MHVELLGLLNSSVVVRVVYAQPCSELMAIFAMSIKRTVA